MLSAISAGATRRSEIAAALGRPASAIAHLLTGLVGIGLIEQTEDALRGKRSTFDITEPVVRLHQLITARSEPELVAGRADRVWERSAPTVSSKIFGPHFEYLARQWCLQYADDQTLGGPPGTVRPTEIGCREHQGGHELDVIVASDPSGDALITAIGEAKQTSHPVDMRQLRRLEHIRGLLPSVRVGRQPRLLLFSRSGFTPDLAEEAAARPDVDLIGLDRIYTGS